MGLLVVGIDEMESTVLFVFGYQELQILFMESINKKSPTAVRSKGNNSFFLREGGNVTLY
jgi:hypothetical protein